MTTSATSAAATSTAQLLTTIIIDGTTHIVVTDEHGSTSLIPFVTTTLTATSTTTARPMTTVIINGTPHEVVTNSDQSTSLIPIQSTSAASSTGVQQSTTHPSTIKHTTTPCLESTIMTELVQQNSVIIVPSVPNPENILPSSNKSLDFPEDNLTPKISVNLPKDTIPTYIHCDGKNVVYLTIVYYGQNGSPLSSTETKPSEISETLPKDVVSKIEITVTQTQDKLSPKGVKLEIVACQPYRKSHNLILYLHHQILF